MIPETPLAAAINVAKRNKDIKAIEDFIMSLVEPEERELVVSALETHRLLIESLMNQKLLGMMLDAKEAKKQGGTITS